MIFCLKGRFVALALALCSSGCAIHPLPEDITGADTHAIARKTRCEARSAVQKNLVDYLLAWPSNSELYRLGVFFTNDNNLKEFDPKMFPGLPGQLIARFANTAIVYDFTLDISEINNLDATIDILNPFHKGASSAALSLGLDRTREASRAFTLSDTFSGLLTKVDDAYCAGPRPGANPLYPLVGEIGIADAIHQFIEMSIFDDLSGPSSGGSSKDKKSSSGFNKSEKSKVNLPNKNSSTSKAEGVSPPTGPSGPPTMTDTLVFTTKLSGSAAPKIVFTPAGMNAHIADATLTGAASRTDVHKVILGFAVPPPQDPKQHSNTSSSGLFVTVYGDRTKQAAGQAIDQSYLRSGVSRGVGTLVPLNIGE